MNEEAKLSQEEISEDSQSGSELADFSELLDESILSPISSDKPCGELAVYGEEYEAVQEQVDILSAPDPSKIEWSIVVEKATEILAEQSKDLTIACYLIVAQFEENGYRGLAKGLVNLNELIDRYWQPMFPDIKRLRGRINAFSWLTEKLELRINTKQPDLDDLLDIEKIFAVLGLLSVSLSAKLLHEAPAISTIERVIGERVSALKKQSEANKPKSVTEEKQQGHNSTAGDSLSGDDNAIIQESSNASSTIVTSSPGLKQTTEKSPISLAAKEDIIKAIDNVQQDMRNVVEFMRSISLSDPMAYYYNRIVTWMPIETSPEHGGDSITPFLDINEMQSEGLKSKLEHNDYEILLEEVESLMPDYPFSLNLHYYSYQALDALGDGYGHAKQIVAAELTHFLTRFPDIASLKFKDGNGFASDETRAWINHSLNSGLDSSNGATVNIATSSQGELLDQVVSEANSAFKKGNFKEGMLHYQSAFSSVRVERDRYILRLKQALYCYEAGRLDIAIPQLEHLDQDARRLSLDTWEPELVVQVITTLLQSYIRLIATKKKAKEDIANIADELFGRLCQLDMASAMEIGNKAWQ